MEMLRPSDLIKVKLHVASEVQQEPSAGLETFYLNPSTYKENLVSNWIITNAPGKNAPHLHWASAGARTITFEALITKEVCELSVNL